jgi:long-chain acyl-CoA synthetase
LFRAGRIGAKSSPQYEKAPVIQSIASLIERFADRSFVSDDSGTRLSYGEAYQAGQSVIGPFPSRSLVLLLCSNTSRSAAAYLSLLASDHVVLLLDQGMQLDLLEGLIERYRPDYVVDPIANESITRPGPKRTVELHPDLAILLATSGSTGSPKLARFRLSSILANAEAIATYLQLDETERPLLHLPISYSFGMSILNSHLLRGAEIALTKRSVVQKEYWERFRSERATSFSGVPFHYDVLRRLGPQRLDVPTLRTMTQAGGRLDPATVRVFAQWTQTCGVRFVIMYGQTEAAPRIAYLPPERLLEAPDSIGIPIPGVSIELRDESGHVLEGAGVQGELVCKGPNVMLGYALEAADLARGDDLEGELATGDIATRDAHGLYRIVGRRSRIIKVYGVRVSLDEVESFLHRRSVVAACFGEDDRLCVAVDGGTEVEPVRQSLIESFSFPPRAIDVRNVHTLPRNLAGKFQYGMLDQYFEPGGPQ